jgi:hypothetical protein
MAERRLVILKHSGKTPVLAKCEKCEIKFFTPRELTNLPVQADEHLWQRFYSHECSYEGRARLRLIRKV